MADEHLKQVAVGVAGTVQVMLPLGGLVDVAALAGKIRRSLEAG